MSVVVIVLYITSLVFIYFKTFLYNFGPAASNFPSPTHTLHLWELQAWPFFFWFFFFFFFFHTVRSYSIYLSLTDLFNLHNAFNEIHQWCHKWWYFLSFMAELYTHTHTHTHIYITTYFSIHPSMDTQVVSIYWLL